MFAINNFREFREWSTFVNIIIRELYVRTYTVYIVYIFAYALLYKLRWCHIKMADVDGSLLFSEALLWTKFNGIIERFSRTYITMGRYLHIIQCKTIELSIHLKMETVRRSFAVVIAFPQLKCTSNERGSKQE